MGIFRPDPKDGRQIYRFLPRGRELKARIIFNSHYARPDIRVRVRRSVIDIHLEQTRISGVIPITAGNATENTLTAPLILHRLVFVMNPKGLNPGMRLNRIQDL